MKSNTEKFIYWMIMILYAFGCFHLVKDGWNNDLTTIGKLFLTLVTLDVFFSSLVIGIKKY